MVVVSPSYTEGIVYAIQLHKTHTATYSRETHLPFKLELKMCLEYTCLGVVVARQFVALKGAVRTRRQGPWEVVRTAMWAAATRLKLVRLQYFPPYICLGSSYAVRAMV